MPTIKRRPYLQPFSPSPQESEKIKQYNTNVMRYVQGFRQAIQGSTTTIVNLTLTAAGKELLGISLIPIGAETDINDVSVTFLVNNNNVLNSIGAQNLNPGFIEGGMIYFPIPQPLVGNDNLQLNFLKNNAGAINLFINVFYMPRI